MEDLLRPIYQERASHRNTLGIIMVEKGNQIFPITDTFNTVLVVITKSAEKPVFIKHYEYHSGKATLYTVTEEQLKTWISQGSNRKFIDWLFNGRVMFDRNDYLEDLKKSLDEFPMEKRWVKIGVEFAKLIRRYHDGKAFFELRQNLDAYNYVIHALHHLARLAVIEKGFHPEVTVWNQVKQIEPQIYKLYVELVESEETLHKRLELLFLASEFLIHSKVKLGATHIVNVLSQRDESWEYGEIMDHPELQIYSVDLEVFIEFLVDKHILDIELVETKGKGIYHRKYKISQS